MVQCACRVSGSFLSARGTFGGAEPSRAAYPAGDHDLCAGGLQLLLVGDLPDVDRESADVRY